MNPALTIAAVELVHAQHAADLDAANRKLEWLERITAPQAIDGLLTDDDIDDLDDIDDIDEAAASDPIHDHIPQAAPMHKVRGVLGILDQLDRETSSRRFIR